MRSTWLAGVLVALVLPSGAAAQTTYSSGGLAFNGIGWMSVPSGGTGLQNSTAFTIEAWVSTNFTGVPQQVLVQKPNSYLFKNQAGVLTFEAQLNPGNVTRTVFWPSAQFTGFHHVAATFDSTVGVLRLIVDGVLRHSVTGLAGNTLVQSSANFRVGGTPSVPGSNGWNGTIDELRVWSLRRSTSEVDAAKSRALRQMPGLELVYSGDGGPVNAAIPNPLVDGTGQRSGVVNGTVVFGAGAVSSAFPGTGADLQLSSSSGGATPDLNGDKMVRNGDAVNFSFESPEGAYVNAPFFWVLQLPADGVTPAPVPGAPDIHIDVFQPYEVVILGTPIPSAGLQFAGTAPLLFTQNLWSQGVAVTPVSPTGYATTDAHLFRFPKAWFADPAAPSGGSGTQTAPFNTLAAALSAASPGDNVFLAIGTFNETLTFDQPINLYGRYDPVTWVKYTSNFFTYISSSHRGTSFAGITDAMSINDVIFASADGLPPGTGTADDRPSIAADIRNCTSALRFDRCKFFSGTGAPGRDVTTTGFALGGLPGNNGAPGIDLGGFPQPSAAGGNGAGLAGDGGNGGYVVCGNYSAGTCWGNFQGVNGGDGGNGASANPCAIAPGGSGGYTAQGVGLTGNYGDPGNAGHIGNAGEPGLGGTSGVAGGYVNSSFRWRPNIAGSGGTGHSGCSGGGGGGGGAYGFNTPGYGLGGGGGGGGQGGVGASGGAGAEEGAPSVCAWIVNASPDFHGCDFNSGFGGRGGNGGNGFAGGNGGPGGNGGAGGVRTGYNLHGGPGGQGGAGGDGGDGGGGGGGCGGAGWGIVRVGTSVPTVGGGGVFSQSTQSGYGGGAWGGLGGSQYLGAPYQGVTGPQGPRANYKNF